VCMLVDGRSLLWYMHKGDLVENGVDLCVVLVCSVTNECDFLMPPFVFSVFCEKCITKYANLEYIFSHSWKYCTWFVHCVLLLRMKICVVDSCRVLPRMSNWYGVSSVKVGYECLVTLYWFVNNYRFRCLEVFLVL
jgi:hypothetical protein